MKNLLLLVLATLGTILVATSPVAAHHGAAMYDLTKVVTLNGTVTKFQFVNPHILIYIDAPGPGGAIEHWTIEYDSPVLATRLGWTRDIMKTGDHIVYQVHPAKNGKLGGAGSGKMIVNGKPMGDSSAKF